MTRCGILLFAILFLDQILFHLILFQSKKLFIFTVTTEIIVQITSYLSLLDKLHLACACKELHKAISENTLYNKLVFNNEVKFNQAMDLYEKINLDQQVRDLSIGNMDYDAQLVTSLPTLFPRVRFLNLKHESGGGFHGVNTHVLKIVMVKNWENVQSIVDTSNIINVKCN